MHEKKYDRDILWLLRKSVFQRLKTCPRPQGWYSSRHRQRKFMGRSRSTARQGGEPRMTQVGISNGKITTRSKQRSLLLASRLEARASSVARLRFSRAEAADRCTCLRTERRLSPPSMGYQYPFTHLDILN